MTAVLSQTASRWSTALPDWEERILSGQSLVPDLPLFRDEANKALRIFKRLRIPDMIGMPTMAEACGEWFFPIVEVVFGSFDSAANRRMIQEYFWLIPKKNSKALALDTLVATPSGFTAIRDIRVGDQVLGADGRPTRVKAKSPVFLQHSCYEVMFSTGEKIVCDAGHLWVTDAHRDRDRRRPAAKKRTPGSVPFPTVKTTEEIAATLRVRSGHGWIKNHGTALSAALDLPEVPLPIPPYALGVWLGDGTSSGSTITQGKGDAVETVAQLVANGQPAYIRDPQSNGAATIQMGVRNTVNLKLPYRFYTEARALGLFGNKHIPAAYLRASHLQRLKLLQGLMDTDGSISAQGQTCFHTTSSQLRDDVRELVNSLGLKTTVSEHRAVLDGRDCGPVWRVQFWPFADLPVFTLARKLRRQVPRSGRNAPRSTTRQIVSVRAVPSAPVQCISVDNCSREFLITRSLIPTHNSSNGGAVMLTALILNRRPQGEFLFIGPTKELADIAFKQAKGTIKADPELHKLFHIQDHIRKITHRRTEATLQVKAADTDVITGSKALGTMIDETHVFAKRAKAAEVFLELRGALTARPDGFLFQTTTQSKEPPSGVFKAELAMARKVRNGEVEFPMLPILYELPLDSSKDGGWKARELWGYVNPNLGRSVDGGFLARELLKAEEQTPAALALFASQHFNVEIGLALCSDAWAGAEFWRANPRTGVSNVELGLSLDDVLERSEVVVVGIDGGGLDDLMGLVVLGRERETGKWLAWCHAWAHEIVKERRKEIAQKLEDIEAAGDLTFVKVPGDDVADIAQIVWRCVDSGLLADKDAIGVDSYGVAGIVQALTADDRLAADLIVGIPQGWQLTGAIKTTERNLAGGTLVHGGSPLMDFAVGNARVEARGNAIVITKQASGTAKIDPLVALFNAVVLMGKNPLAGGSYLDNEDLMVM